MDVTELARQGGGEEWVAPRRRACWGLCVGICPVREAEPHWPTWPRRLNCFKAVHAHGQDTGTCSVPGSVLGPLSVISLK